MNVDRAWIQARVDQHGSVDRARPEGVTWGLWRDTCKTLGITARKKNVELEAALRKLADSAQP